MAKVIRKMNKLIGAECLYGVIESGSNSNGNYIKFSDGTMICTLNITVTNQEIKTAYHSLYQGSRIWTFPQTFVTAPVVTCGMFKGGTGASWGSVSSVSSASATLRGTDVTARDSGTQFKIQAMAIGKWKKSNLRVNIG